MGARLRWASETMRTICASRVSEPTRSARITNEPVPLTVAPVRRAPAFFSTGIGSPEIMDSSTELVPSTTTTVDWNLFAGTDAELVADLHLFERDIRFRAVFASRRAVFGARPRSALNGCAGLAAGLEFQNLAEQHQGDDHGGGFEVTRLARPTERRRPGCRSRRRRCRVRSA